MRRILILTSALVFIDVFYFAVFTPLLPEYVSDLGLSDTEAGILSGAYAIGSLAAALPAGFLAQRFGPRPVVCLGLLVLSAASAALGWVNDVVVLDVARLMQGVAGAVIWSGAITWLIASAHSNRKGEMVGISVSAGGVGALVGPAIGALAVSVGTDWVFTVMLIFTLPLCIAVALSEDVPQFEHQPVREVASAILTRPVLNAVALLSLPALAFGFVTVLVPLKIDGLGGSAGLIAIAFISSGLIETVLGPLSGRWSDRAGRRAPYVGGLTIFCVGLGAMAATQTLSIMVAFFLFATVGAGMFISPAFAMFSDAAEHSDLAQAHAFALSNTAMSLGLAVGAPVAGALASTEGTASPFLVMILILMALAVYARRALPARQPARATTS